MHPYQDHRLSSALAESMLARIELLELLRRRARWCPGSLGCRPVDLAKVLSISVREMTPLNLPDIRAPIKLDAGTTGAICGDGGAPLGATGAGPPGKLPGPVKGVAGAVGDGDAESTTHIRCDLVATSLATVCARVEYGLT